MNINSIHRGFWLLVLVLGGLQVATAQTTYLTVGCGGGVPNFTSLRLAFSYVESNTFPGDVDISICSGTYNENAYITGSGLSTPGAKVYVHSATYNPADVTLRPFSLFQPQVLRIHGFQGMEFEGLTLEVATAGTGIRRHVVRTQAAAGDLAFKNCRMLGKRPLGGIYNPENYAVIRAVSLNDPLQLFDCEITGGAMGINVATASGLAILNVQGCHLFNVETDGIRVDVPIFLTQIDDSHINLVGSGDWNGVTTTYGPGTRLFMDSTVIITNGGNRVHGILARAEEVQLTHNAVLMADHSKAFGITLHPEASFVDIADNRVDYPGLMISSIRPDSFMGIQRPPAVLGNNNQLDHLFFEGNEVRCDGADDGQGIYVEFNGEDVNNGVKANGNLVDLDDWGSNVASEIAGIGLRSIVEGEVSSLELSENRVQVKAKGGNFSFGVVVESFYSLDHITCFNNTIHYISTVQGPSGTAWYLRRLQGDVGKNVYLGNNMVSVLRQDNRAVTGLHISMEAASNHYLWHNSVNVYGNHQSYTSWALEVDGSSSGGAVDLQDNIFSNVTDGLAFENQGYLGNWSFSESNCYYVGSGPRIGKWGATTLATLADFQAITPSTWDNLSVDFNPGFVAGDDLHLAAGSSLLGYNGKKLIFGGPTLVLNQDIDGDARTLIDNREIGADEKSLPVVQFPFKTSPPRPVDDALTLFPQPARDKVWIQWEGHPNASFQLFSSSGQFVKSIPTRGTTTELQLDGLSPGLYFLRAQDQECQRQHRLILQ